MHKGKDCIVIGAGIVGMLTAMELANQGVKVCIFDKFRFGTECSWAGGGILSPLKPWRLPVSMQPLVNLSQALYPELVDKLMQTTGIDTEYQTSGLLIFDEVHKDAQQWAELNKIQLQLFERKDLDNIQPSPGSHFQHALWLPDVKQIRNPRLLESIKNYLYSKGVELRSNEPARKINLKNGNFVSIDTDAGNYKSENCIIASGAWSNQLMPELPVYPVRGQMLCYFDNTRSINHILLHDNTYIIPRRDGHVLVGSTLEEAGFDNQITRSAREELYHNACRILPSFKAFDFVRQWSGLRPASYSEYPLIGAHPDIQGLFINTGHFRNGLLLAVGSARILADIIFGNVPEIPVDIYQYRPDRLALNS